MQTSKLFLKLPEDLACTPDGMTIDSEGDLVLSCPNFADLSMPSCVLKIDKDRNVRHWFDVPKNPYSGEARAMGIEFGPEGDIFLVDNAGWTGRPNMVYTGRILRLKVDEGGVTQCTVVADNMEHPNGLRIRNGHIYVTQSCMERQKTESGKLMSCVYCFPVDLEDYHCTNTLADDYILETFITENPKCQYGVDGIMFDHAGDLYVGNFGDGAVHKLVLSEDGTKVVENTVWAKDPANLKSTDGMSLDRYGNIYVADFSANAIAKITPDGTVTRIASSPDTDGFNGELDQPGEPCVWGDKIIISCFDLVTDDDKVNTAHEMPATMAMLDVEP
ncbi:SMP-30/gluconolactonase/LRE family protein [uncultured Oscillibacter sp.]|uniref:SMP-30/gluconolactonase/LRE family protein n=1 Tax=uncultured Oscillibacter sp. TaxID=876091 RepID=UPI0025F4E38C|nr:SMP-30/gluconolactonase/LRE family protein [uncultured Oscillibacter sp.]